MRKWFALHWRAFRLGVDADWLRDRQRRFALFLANQERRARLRELQQQTIEAAINAGWTENQIAMLLREQRSDRLKWSVFTTDPLDLLD